MKKHSMLSAGILATVVVSAIASSVKASEIPSNDYSINAQALSGVTLQVQPEKNVQEYHAQGALPGRTILYERPANNYWYLGGDVGVGFPNSITENIPNSLVTVSAGLNSGFAGSVKGGYQLERTRLEGEVAFGFFNANRVSFNVNGSPAGSADITASANYVALMANGYYGIPLKSKFRPYVGGGIGIAFLSLGDITVPGVGTATGSGGSSTNFAYQVKAGIEYEVAPKGNAYLEYKYLNTTGNAPLGVNAVQVGYRQGF